MTPFEPEMDIWFIDYSDEGIGDKKFIEVKDKRCGLWGMKGSTYSKIMRSTGSILAGMQHNSVVWQIA